MELKMLNPGIPTYIFTELKTTGLVLAGTSTADGGKNLALHTGLPRESALRDRKSFFTSIGINPEDICVLNQTHSTTIIPVTETNRGMGALDHLQTVDGDALITDTPKLPLMILTADCAPLFLLDPVRKAIGLVHAGWKGVAAGILSKTIHEMGERFDCKTSNLLLGIGPMIRSCCYEVGTEMGTHFDKDLFLHKNQRMFLDLPQAIIRQATSEGLQIQNIFDSGLCTCCISHFHSYRRDKTAGRIGSYLMLK